MKRQILIATLAAAAIGVAGCGGAESAGRDIGYAIGALQTTTATKIVEERLKGLTTAIESLKDQLPAETYEQLEAIQEHLEHQLETAENHPDALAAASSEAAQAIAALSATDEQVKQLQEAVREAYSAASGEQS
ncbi:MAG: hypothetical protein QM679_11330 [Patulibacter sp.]